MDFTDDQLERYSRHIILREVGGEGQKALMKAKVLVVGAGGLGSPVCLYLAAAGIGAIGIVDDDVVDLSNLQRQIIHQTQAIDGLKVNSAKAAMRALNPEVTVVTYPERLTVANIDSIIEGYDIIADGTDNFETRLLVSDTCVKLEKTLVSAALGPFDGQLATFKPHTHGDQPCYRCFVPEAPTADGQGTCADNGVLGAVAGVMGSMQALEVLKEIVGVGDSLAGKMLFYDALTAKQRVVKLPRDPSCAACGKLGGKLGGNLSGDQT